MGQRKHSFVSYEQIMFLKLLAIDRIEPVGSPQVRYKGLLRSAIPVTSQGGKRRAGCCPLAEGTSMDTGGNRDRSLPNG